MTQHNELMTHISSVSCAGTAAARKSLNDANSTSYFKIDQFTLTVIINNISVTKYYNGYIATLFVPGRTTKLPLDEKNKDFLIIRAGDHVFCLRDESTKCR